MAKRSYSPMPQMIQWLVVSGRVVHGVARVRAEPVLLSMSARVCPPRHRW